MALPLSWIVLLFHTLYMIYDNIQNGSYVEGSSVWYAQVIFLEWHCHARKHRAVLYQVVRAFRMVRPLFPNVTLRQADD